MSALSFSRKSMSISHAKIPASPQILSFLYPSNLPRKAHSRCLYRNPAVNCCTVLPCTVSPQSVDKCLIGALVAAGTCNRHLLKVSAPAGDCRLLHSIHKASAKLFKPSRARVHRLHTLSRCDQALAVAQQLNRDDYIGMLDYYGRGQSVDGSVPVLRPLLPPVHTDEPNTKEAEIPRPQPSADIHRETLTSEQRQAVKKFKLVIAEPAISNEKLFRYYRALPSPGVLYLNNRQRRRLLRRLSIEEKRTETSTLRYLSVLDDMKAADLPLNAAEWSSAIHLAGRSFSKVTSVEVEAALRLWKEMEQQAGTEGSSVTFHILFDIAIKAGKFALAEMILEEMKARKLDHRRFAYVSLIYYHGIKEDGDGIRNTYRDLIDAGQIVDTTVLNCVIASLYRANEPSAAEQVYERMKMMYTRQTGVPTSGNWKKSREFGRVLDRAALNRNPAALRVLQDSQSLAPDEHTYVVLITHHVSHTGELHRIASFLDDMQVIGLPLSGRLFMEVFRGFAIHGGVRLSSWTSSRLESVWSALQDALSDDNQKIHVAKWLAIWIVRAFARCCGRKRTTEIWNELRSRWKPTDQDQAVVSAVIGKALETNSHRSHHATR